VQIFHSVSDNLLITAGVCCAHDTHVFMLCMYLKSAALGCLTDDVLVEVFCIFGKILLFELEVSRHFYSKTLQ